MAIGETRRLQHRSCDQCRKGKRACDASRSIDHHPHAGINVPAVEPCSNCRRWRRQCTFNWLLSVQNKKSSRKKTKSNHQYVGQDREIAAEGNPLLGSNPSFLSSQPQIDGLHGQPSVFQNNDPLPAPSTWDDPLVFSDLLDGARLGVTEAEKPQLVSPPYEGLYSQLSLSSQSFADHFFRSETARNLLRVYHDSVENALTCWLTERNCPYSRAMGLKWHGRGSSRSKISISIDGEWGPQWSNRVCARVCRLDRAYSTVRGRNLTVTEERMASRALHASIMAFASQWSPESVPRPSQSAEGDTYGGTPGKDFERSVPERLWNEASHVLHEAANIESFRVIFAHIIFSLTQRPLDGGRNVHSNSLATPPSLPTDSTLQKTPGLVELHELFDSDSAPLFLETAMRQMFSSRHKLTLVQRQGDGKSEFLSAEDHETFNLLFWLGVMFDTLTAAMYQRPLVVSDEDSEINCAVVPRRQLLDGHIDLDGWDFGFASHNARESTRRHVWGDLFLHKEVSVWPCSYEAAAETLSDAAPVKVLLFRRVTRLQTLVYRGVGPEQLEDAIQDTFQIYDYWNHTYGLFMLDCIAHHDSLPPRIQSWYVLIAGHWHLAAILLADTVESIDNARMGLESPRESRRATDLVSELKRENAVTISRLAQSSLRGSRGGGEFHDVVINDGAFLTEPWTAVLIRSFARAGYILLDRLTAYLPLSENTFTFDEEALLQCRYCIDALWSLGKKSDMASVAARSLSNNLDETMIRLHGRSESVLRS
ncbi:hypothetical protein VTN77DRAFT_4959 [Rasamsonia byssochlamydoides]|uniref:uncharacterized protein n=1 Tax=Rasamsonia byssochlamydoides TaxID=89139 RepID=UPI003742B6FB